MEVLNQNQRRSAMLRILALGGFILAVLGTVLVSMHNAYASNGVGELETLQNKFKKERNIWEGKKNDFQLKINKLKKELNECKANSNKPDQRLEICEERIKGKDDRIDELEQGLTRCESRLQAATNY